MSMILSTWASPSMPSKTASGLRAPCRRFLSTGKLDAIENGVGLARAVQAVLEHGQEGVDDQAGFSRARNSSHTGQHAEREGHGEVARVVGAGASQKLAG